MLEADIRYPTAEEVVAYHADVLAISGVEPCDSVRDWNLLVSALNRPRTAAYYEAADVIRQASSLLWGLIENHPFYDGNKRTAWITTEVFLEANQYRVRAEDDAIFTLVVGIAQGLPLEEAEGWLRAHVAAGS